MAPFGAETGSRAARSTSFLHQQVKNKNRQLIDASIYSHLHLLFYGHPTLVTRPLARLDSSLLVAERQALKLALLKTVPSVE